MKSKSMDTLLEEMDLLKTNFTYCRAYFPAMCNNMKGHSSLHTPEFYVAHLGFCITSYFDQPLTEERIHKNHEIGHWINQNVIVRLCALLESYHILSKTICIDKSLRGWKDLDLLRRLRNHFAHGSGKYDSNDGEQRKLAQELICHFKLGNNLEDLTGFPLPIDEVIHPLFEGCKKYVQVKKHREEINA